MKIPLARIAHTRSGDKGDTCNIGVIAYGPSHHPKLLREVPSDRVKRQFAELFQGQVERFELPNLGALNFLLHRSLSGGERFRSAPTRRARPSARHYWV